MRWVGRIWAEDPVPSVPVEPREGMAWCSNCDADRPYWVKAGAPSYDIPDWVFCTHCGCWLPDVEAA